MLNCIYLGLMSLADLGSQRPQNTEIVVVTVAVAVFASFVHNEIWLRSDMTYSHEVLNAVSVEAVTVAVGLTVRVEVCAHTPTSMIVVCS